MQRKTPINAFHLKLLMAALMVLDHLYYYFPQTVPHWFTVLGRLVAPTFAYLMTQGMVHTSNRLRYIRRMLFWGLGMLAGNLILQQLVGRGIPMNIFLSLTVSAAIIACIDRASQGNLAPLYVLAAVALLYLSLYCEGGFLLPVISIIFYYLRDRPVAMSLVYAAASSVIVYFFFTPVQYWMVAALVPILLYNGRRGPNNAFTKHFFYVFYPLHIWLLFAMKYVG